MQTNSRIEELSKQIEENHQDIDLLMERAKAYHKAGYRQQAINDFLEVRRIDPLNSEAKVYIDLIHSIYEFGYKEIYNP